jgi:hypothetical protein
VIYEFLNKEQRQALERLYALTESGSPVFVNVKRNGFDAFRASDALGLLISGVAEVYGGQLHISALGYRLLGAVKHEKPSSVSGGDRSAGGRDRVGL